MDKLKSQIDELLRETRNVTEQLGISAKTAELEKLRVAAAAPDFWSDTNRAQVQSKRLAKLEQAVEPWLELENKVAEIAEFSAMDDTSLEAELSDKLSNLRKTLDKLKGELRFAGPHDEDDALLTIQAGAGGTDAQDWTEMLKRMYLKWADRHNLRATELSETAGEEAGLKNTSLLLSGHRAYGLMKSEHGVHRLVRMSPFNSAGSRETSFAMVEVVPQLDEPDSVEISDDELKVDVFRAGGHGGQSVNTTDSAVRLTHLPTGISVAIQNERSQIQNKATAMNVLKSKLAQLAEEQHQAKMAELKGPNIEAAWGNQIRSYVLHPYTMVKDNRTGHETSDVDGVLGGSEALDEFIDAYLETTLGSSEA